MTLWSFQKIKGNNQEVVFEKVKSGKPVACWLSSVGGAAAASSNFEL